MSDNPKGKREDELLSGNYDGIQEYDNDLPRWWLNLFYLTIAGGIVYAIVVHLTGAPSDLQTVAAEMSALKAAQRQSQSPALESEEQLAASFNDVQAIAKGKEVFALKCAACHGQNGEGLVGPNLTDDSWIHGGSAIKIKESVENGVPAKGMLAWKGLLPDNEIHAVLSYLWQIRNTNLPGKAPEGTKG